MNEPNEFAVIIDTDEVPGEISLIEFIEGEPEKEHCGACGQIDHGQTGEYPCAECGLPTLHDQPESHLSVAPELEVAKKRVEELELALVETIEDDVAGAEKAIKCALKAEARAENLERELAAKESTIADLKDYNERTIKIAAEECRAKTAELEARLAEISKTVNSALGYELHRDALNAVRKLADVYKDECASANEAFKKVENLQSRESLALQLAEQAQARGKQLGAALEEAARDAVRLEQERDSAENKMQMFAEMNAKAEARESRLRAIVEQTTSNMLVICNLTDNKYIDEIATQTVDELLAALRAPEPPIEKEADHANQQAS